MSKLCVFAGTAEGRCLVEFLAKQPVSVTACVATEYGEKMLPVAEHITVSEGRLNRDEMEEMLRRESFDFVIDATHPYAVAVTENLSSACNAVGVPYLRLLRETGEISGAVVTVESTEAAVAYLNEHSGNVFLTTGSNDLKSFSLMHDFSNRVFARVLPVAGSLAICEDVGLCGSHVIAMQGPFSEEMNVAMLRFVKADYMVTKQTGSIGGFAEKLAAAEKTGVTVIVIDKPLQQEGKTLSETIDFLCDRFSFSLVPSVSVVGIGPGHGRVMTEEVQCVIREADCLIGAPRMLEAVSNGKQNLYHAISPKEIADYILSHREFQRFAVVMSGDTGFFSGTKKLLPLLERCNVRVLPGISSLSYLCSRLGTSYEDVVLLSLHGREESIMNDICRHPRSFVLVGGENGIGKLCMELTENGLGEAKVSVGERLSYSDEKISVGKAEDLAKEHFQSLGVALIEHSPIPRVVTHGLSDEMFLRSSGNGGVVPMTKSEVRSVVLSKLQLSENSLCWDVGAGTGSVSVEMALQSQCGRVYAIEQKEAAVMLLTENCHRFGVSNVTVVPGVAPMACVDLPAPDRVFIGGSSGNMKEIISLALGKNPAVRIVATAIALESVAELMDCMRTFAFAETEIVALNVSRSYKAGAYHLMSGQNPVYIFTMQTGENLI